jgi:phage tail tape-measure protein
LVFYVKYYIFTQNSILMSVGGDTLSGAASGAALGSAFGPWGTAIGGVVGAGAGLISGLDKKKKRDDAAKKVNRPT